jgi:hypothetical protein
MSSAEHRIETRPLTDDELRRVARKTRAGFAASWGCLALPAAIVTFGLQWIGTEMMGWPGRLAGLAIGFVLFAILARGFRQFENETRARLRADIESGIVEEIHVQTSRAMRLDADHSSIDPALCFDIGGGKLLFVVGQWIVNEPRLIGVPAGAVHGDIDEDVADTIPNRLPPPWSFPSERFTLSRLIVSGEVLGIRVEGPFLTPSKGPLLEAAHHRVRSSMIVDGDLEALDKVLAGLRRRESC